MATRTVPFRLEMLTFGHPESSGGTRQTWLGTLQEGGWTRGGPMATRSEPFSLEMLTFGHPESSGTLAGGGRDAGRPQATETVPFSLEMPTFSHPESSGALGGGGLTREGLRPPRQCLLVGNAYIWPPRELRHTRQAQADAGRAYGHSHSAF